MKPLLLLLLLLGFSAAQESSKHVTGVDVTKQTINQTLTALPADAKVLMEFYATWCPACRAFKPEYDKVAKFLGSVPAGQANKVYAFRLDCAVDQDVCGQYQVQAYPTMYAGSAADVAVAAVPKLSKFDYGKYSRNAPGVVKFVAEHFKLDLTYVEVPEEKKPLDTVHPGKGVTQVAVDLQWTAPDVQLATSQLFDSITAQNVLHSNEQQREALTQLLQVWAATHPVPACKSGAAEVLKELPEKWPRGKAAPVSDLKTLSVCGDCSAASSCTGATPADAVAALAGSATSKAAPAKPELTWVACKGTRPEARGFTCALWLLFHTTAARVTDGDGAKLFMASLKGFAFQFFQCQVCKNHFERVTDSAEAAAIKTRRDAVLWVWRAHNEVNGRLAKIEAKYGHSSTGDAAFPKIQWPPESACPQCRLPVLAKKADERGGSDGGRRTGESSGSHMDAEIKWNEEELYRFLMKWYGGEPGTGEPVGGAAAGPVLLGGRADDEENLLETEGGAATALLGNVILIAGVAMAAAVMLWWYGRSQQRRKFGLGVKGPGVAGHKGHGVHAHGLPKHGGSSGHVGNSNGEAWGQRYIGRKEHD